MSALSDFVTAKDDTSTARQWLGFVEVIVVTALLGLLLALVLQVTVWGPREQACTAAGGTLYRSTCLAPGAVINL